MRRGHRRSVGAMGDQLWASPEDIPDEILNRTLVGESAGGGTFSHAFTYPPGSNPEEDDFYHPGLAHLRRRGIIIGNIYDDAPGVGLMRGPANPCNLMIEHDRLERGGGSPAREVLLTYRDMDDPSVLDTCDDTVIRAAKQKRLGGSAYKAILRAGMKSWY